MAGFTPMMQQYFQIKEQYKDSILMYRVGDFYEMFFEDAVKASKALELVLTGKDCGQEERAPMCGVPFHAADTYISRLVEQGFSVAICEQVEDPKQATTLVKRDVIRVVTPGTIMDSSALDDKKNNYLCALLIDEKGFGIAFADITTGEIISSENSSLEEILILNEMAKYQPSEVIVNLMAYEKSELIEKINERFGVTVRNYYNWAFDIDEAGKKIAETLGEDSGLAEKKRCTGAIGTLLHYLEETQKAEPKNLRDIEVSAEDEYMNLDMYSLRNLELVETMRDKKAKGSLLNIINKTKTSMGSRMMRRWLIQPLKNCVKIRQRHDAVEELKNKPIQREEIIELLKGIQDIERIIGRITYKTANCKDLLAIRNSCSYIPEIKNILTGLKAGVIEDLAENLDTLSDISELIDISINEEAPISLREGNLIKTGYNKDIDYYREVIRDGKQWIKDCIDREREKTGLKIKEGYNRVFGYYLEITKAQKAEVPEYFIRRQTLANAERYITEEIKSIEEKIVEAESKIVAMEYEMFCQIRDRISENVARIQETASIIAQVDVLCSLAYVAEKNGYTKPYMNMGDKIVIKDGRHPVVEKINTKNIFIANDTNLDCGNDQISIITGPNMAGKSTYMRQVAQIVILAQMGSFVPASHAELGIIDSVFTRVGASDDLSAGQSTFMVEMNEVAYILDNATKNSLIILDEIGRGTSTYDGLSIAWAVVEFIANHKKCGAKTLFATHYHELTELEEKIENVKNYCIAVKKNGDDIIFLRKNIRGGADGSYGIEVAGLAGVKKDVLKRAKEILLMLEERDGREITVSKKKEKRETGQLGFMGMEENEIISEIENMDLDSMSPMDALTKLYAIKAKIKNM